MSETLNFEGIVEGVKPKEGSKPWAIVIDSKWYSCFEKEPPQKGDKIKGRYFEKGTFNNLLDWELVESAPKPPAEPVKVPEEKKIDNSELVDNIAKTADKIMKHSKDKVDEIFKEASEETKLKATLGLFIQIMDTAQKKRLL